MSRLQLEYQSSYQAEHFHDERFAPAFTMVESLAQNMERTLDHEERAQALFLEALDALIGADGVECTLGTDRGEDDSPRPWSLFGSVVVDLPRAMTTRRDARQRGSALIALLAASDSLLLTTVEVAIGRRRVSIAAARALVLQHARAFGVELGPGAAAIEIASSARSDEAEEAYPGAPGGDGRGHDDDDGGDGPGERYALFRDDDEKGG